MPTPELQIRETTSGLNIPLHVQPRAKRNELAGVYNGALKVKIAAPPVDDAANRAVVAFFSSLLNLPRSRMQIVAGTKSRDKILHINSISASDFLSLIQLWQG